MELNEAANRILRGHLKLIAALVLLGLALASGVYFAGGVKYTAASRVQLGTPDPQDPAQAVAIADTARAVVTSPSHVQSAISVADVNRTVPEVTKAITVQPLGSSGVVELSVTDTDPSVAAKLANRLADDLLLTRVNNSRGADQLPGLQRQIDADAQAIVDIDTRTADLNNKLASLSDVPASPANEGAIALQIQIVTNQLNGLQQQRSSLVQELGNLHTQRDALLQNSGAQSPAVIQQATAPSSPDRTQLPVDLALGGLLGLVAGVALATIMEVLRPTLIGRRALANLLGVPVIGHLDGGSPAVFTSLPAPLTQRLHLAAQAAGVSVVRLIGAPTTDGIPTLAKRLQRSVAAADSSSLAVQSYGASDPAPDGDWSVGLVVLAPEVLKKVELQPLMDLIRLSRWPVLGVITYGAAGLPGSPRNGHRQETELSPTVALAESSRTVEQ